MGFLRWLFSPFARVLSGPSWLFAVPRRLLGLSLPGRVTAALAIFFALCLVAYCVNILYIRGQNFAALRTAFEGGYLIPLSILMAALLVAAYWTTRFWIEVEPGVFPDIDEAWQAGVSALAKAGVDIDLAPLFLVLGVRDPQAAQTLMEGSGWDLCVSGQPEGDTPLRWYASRDAILLFALDASGLSLCQDPRAARAALGGGGGGAADLGRTLDASALAGAGFAPDRGAGGNRETLASMEGFDGFVTQPAGGDAIRGTLASDAMPLMPGFQSGAAAPPAQVDRVEIDAQARRLERVCQLARHARQPYCTLNGVLAMVGWKSLCVERPTSLPAGLREDSRTIVAAAGIHAPLLVVVGGMEGESGFMELVRRVGETPARDNRFGQGFDHQSTPTPTLMQSLANNASAAFEGWVYDLFRKPECLRMGNNDKLFAMLCRVRSIVQPRLSDLLVGFAESVPPGERRSLLLGGCYFAATGHGRARQAFIRSALAKLISMQDELEWTDDSWRAENRYRRIVQIFTFINGLLVVFIVGTFIWKYVAA